MSTLQQSLLILALVVIAMVLAYNLWQNRRRSRRHQGRHGEPRTLTEPRFAKPAQSESQWLSGAAIAPRPAAPGDIAPAARDAGRETGPRQEMPDPPGEMPARAPVPAPDEAVHRRGEPLPNAANPARARLIERLAQVTSGELPTPGAKSAGAARPEAKAEPSDAQRDSAVAVAAARREPTLGSVEQLDREPSAPGVDDLVPEARSVLSRKTDCIVELELPAPVRGERLISVTQSLRRVGSKTVIFEGHEIATNEWSLLEPRVTYGTVRVGLLLANRHGPLSAMEFSEFAAALAPIAEQLDSLLDLPDMAPVLDDARRLDAQCAALDAQIGLTIETAQPFDQRELARVAQTAGLIARGGQFVKVGPHGDTLFRLEPSERRISVTLDLPRAAQNEQPWRQMIDCTISVAARFSGRIVDDSGRPLDLRALESIEAQLHDRYAALAQAGFAAGSPAALRLFN